MNKYVIRRAIAGIVVTPAVAGIYFLIYATLVAGGAQPTSSATEVWNIGLMIGVVTSIGIVFYEKIMGIKN